MSDVHRCKHIKTNGIQCGSPALRNRDFCHFHRQAYIDFPQRRVTTAAPDPVINLGFMDDPDGIHYALTKIAYGLLNGTIDPKTAGRVTYVLQTMSSNFKHTSFKLQQEDEYRASDLNAYEIWDKANKEFDEEDKKKLHAKRVAELRKLERTCCKCRTQVDDPASLTPPLPPSAGVPHPSPSGEGAPQPPKPTVKEWWEKDLEIKACADSCGDGAVPRPALSPSQAPGQTHNCHSEERSDQEPLWPAITPPTGVPQPKEWWEKDLEIKACAEILPSAADSKLPQPAVPRPKVRDDVYRQCSYTLQHASSPIGRSCRHWEHGGSSAKASNVTFRLGRQALDRHCRNRSAAQMHTQPMSRSAQCHAERPVSIARRTGTD